MKYNKQVIIATIKMMIITIIIVIIIVIIVMIFDGQTIWGQFNTIVYQINCYIPITFPRFFQLFLLSVLVLNFGHNCATVITEISFSQIVDIVHEIIIHLYKYIHGKFRNFFSLFLFSFHLLFIISLAAFSLFFYQLFSPTFSLLISSQLQN